LGRNKRHGRGNIKRKAKICLGGKSGRERGVGFANWVRNSEAVAGRKLDDGKA